MAPTFRMTFDNTGHFRNRSLSYEDTARAGQETINGEARILEAVPEGLGPMVAQRLAALGEDVAILERVSLRPVFAPHDPIPASEGVRALVTAPVQLTNPVMFNYLIDRYIGALYHCLEGAAVGPEDNPRVVSARVLMAHLFEDGRSFLSRSNVRQWHYVDVHFNRIPEAMLTRADTAGVREALERVRILNAHFALMLGVDPDSLDEVDDAEPEPPEEPPAAVRDRILSTLTRFLGLAHFIWPTPEEAEQRALLVGPYLRAIAERNANRGPRIPTPLPVDPEPAPA